MGLSERLASMQSRPTGLPCGISLVLDSMTDDEREVLERILFEEPRVVPNNQLQEALIEEGYDVSFSSVKLHRRKQCRCFTGKARRMSVIAK